jgi:hypothetical protein
MRLRHRRAHRPARRGARVRRARRRIMEAASKGAARTRRRRRSASCPRTSKADANPYVTIAIPTGLGMARNVPRCQRVRRDHRLPRRLRYPEPKPPSPSTAAKASSTCPAPGTSKKPAALEGKRFIEAFDARQAVGMALGEIGKAGRGL